MNNRTFRTMLATALVVCTMMLTAGVNHASAQQQNLNCCTLTIDVLGIPAACFPITFVTDWCPTGTFTYTVAGNGLWVMPVPGVCPFAPYFTSVALPGGPVVMLGSSGTLILCGAAHTYTATLDAASCVYITLR